MLIGSKFTKIRFHREYFLQFSKMFLSLLWITYEWLCPRLTVQHCKSSKSLKRKFKQVQKQSVTNALLFAFSDNSRKLSEKGPWQCFPVVLVNMNSITLFLPVNFFENFLKSIVNSYFPKLLKSFMEWKIRNKKSFDL